MVESTITIEESAPFKIKLSAQEIKEGKLTEKLAKHLPDPEDLSSVTIACKIFWITSKKDH